MLNLIAVFLVCSGIGIAVHIAIDLTHRPQSMKIMNAVWILSALWGSYLALWAYNKFGRSSPMKMKDDGMKGMGMSDMKDMDMSGMKDMNMPDMKGMDMDMSMGEMRRPYWQSVALSALHCGAGCTLVDIIGEWFTNYVPVTVAGSQLVGNWVLDFVLALIIGTLISACSVPLGSNPYGTYEGMLEDCGQGDNIKEMQFYSLSCDYTFTINKNGTLSANVVYYDQKTGDEVTIDSVPGEVWGGAGLVNIQNGKVVSGSPEDNWFDVELNTGDTVRVSIENNDMTFDVGGDHEFTLEKQ